ncbi:MAG: hypothetical protein EB039_08570, partial [Proteobacteria bacterium]|nr:hypothetical protein [Pseudomonadota bacterium]
HSLLARMRELAVQAANDTLTTADRANLNAEFTQLMTEITRVSNAVTFNGTYLLNNASTNVTLQLGANSTAATNQLSFALTNNTAAGTGIALTSNDVTSAANALLAIAQLDTAITTVSTNRANLGALQSRLESASRSLAVAAENTAAANSRVADAVCPSVARIRRIPTSPAAEQIHVSGYNPSCLGIGDHRSPPVSIIAVAVL